MMHHGYRVDKTRVRRRLKITTINFKESDPVSGPSRSTSIEVHPTTSFGPVQILWAPIFLFGKARRDRPSTQAVRLDSRFAFNLNQPPQTLPQPELEAEATNSLGIVKPCATSPFQYS